MKTKPWLTKLLLVLAVLVAGPDADASLIGDTFTLDYRFPDTSTVQFSFGTAVVGAGVEFDTSTVSHRVFSGEFLFDIDSLSIVMSTTVPTGGAFGVLPFNGFQLSDPGISGSITGFVLSTNIPLFTAGSVSFGSDFVRMDLSGFDLDVGNYVRLDLTTEATPTPEPGTLILLGSGLAGLALVRRRKV